MVVSGGGGSVVVVVGIIIGVVVIVVVVCFCCFFLARLCVCFVNSVSVFRTGVLTFMCGVCFSSLFLSLSL